MNFTFSRVFSPFFCVCVSAASIPVHVRISPSRSCVCCFFFYKFVHPSQGLAVRLPTLTGDLSGYLDLCHAE